MYSFGDKSESTVITLRDCDKKSVIEIQNELDSSIKNLNNGKNLEHNRRKFIMRWMPSL